ncbi:leucine-rich repeat domain-containing protein [Deltaproteobacteria bacterium TL4]
MRNNGTADMTNEQIDQLLECLLIMSGIDGFEDSELEVILSFIETHVAEDREAITQFIKDRVQVVLSLTNTEERFDQNIKKLALTLDEQGKKEVAELVVRVIAADQEFTRLERELYAHMKKVFELAQEDSQALESLQMAATTKAFGLQIKINDAIEKKNFEKAKSLLHDYKSKYGKSNNYSALIEHVFEEMIQIQIEQNNFTEVQMLLEELRETCGLTDSYEVLSHKFKLLQEPPQPSENKPRGISKKKKTSKAGNLSLLIGLTGILAVIAITGLIFWKSTLEKTLKQTRPSVASLTVQTGNVSINRNNKTEIVQQPQFSLYEDDFVFTDSSGVAVIHFQSGDTLEIQRLTKVLLMSQNANDSTVTLVTLKQGRIRVQIKKRSQEQVKVTTPTSQVTVIGTDFIVEFEDSVTRVGTLEGKVELASLMLNEKILIPAGQMSTNSQTGNIQALTPLNPSFLQGSRLSSEGTTPSHEQAPTQSSDAMGKALEGPVGEQIQKTLKLQKETHQLLKAALEDDPKIGDPLAKPQDLSIEEWNEMYTDIQKKNKKMLVVLESTTTAGILAQTMRNTKFPVTPEMWKDLNDAESIVRDYQTYLKDSESLSKSQSVFDQNLDQYVNVLRKSAEHRILSDFQQEGLQAGTPSLQEMQDLYKNVESHLLPEERKQNTQALLQQAIESHLLKGEDPSVEKLQQVLSKFQAELSLEVEKNERGVLENRIAEMSPEEQKQYLEIRQKLSVWNVTELKQQVDTYQAEFSQMPPIRSADLSGMMHVKDLGPLTLFPELTRLNLSFTGVEQGHALSQLKNLVALNLASTSLASVIFLNELTQLTSLNLSHTPIQSLDSLSQLKQLHSLNLQGTQVRDLKALADLTSLEQLNLSYVPVSNLSPLAQLTQMKVLKLRGVPLTELNKVTQGMNQLRELDISMTGITNISSLNNLNQLTHLDLSGNPIHELEVLKWNRNLRQLDLSHTQVKNLKGIANLTSLQVLKIRGVVIEDLSVLKSLRNLRQLELQGTQIRDLSVLKELKQLKISQ